MLAALLPSLAAHLASLAAHLAFQVVSSAQSARLWPRTPVLRLQPSPQAGAMVAMAARQLTTSWAAHRAGLAAGRPTLAALPLRSSSAAQLPAARTLPLAAYLPVSTSLAAVHVRW